MDELPTDIFRELSKYLTPSDRKNLRLVCSRFANCTCFQSKRYHVKNIQDLIDYDLSAKNVSLFLDWKCFHNSPFVPPDKKDTYWAANVEKVDQLKLEILDHPQSIEVFLPIVPIFKKLKVIELLGWDVPTPYDQECGFLKARILERSVCSLVTAFGEQPDLTELTYQNCSEHALESFTILALKKWANQLRKLWVPHTRSRKLSCVKEFQEAMESFGPQLEETNVFLEFNGSVMEGSLEALLKRLPNLRKVALPYFLSHWTFLENVTHLAVASVDENLALGSPLILVLPEMPNLQALDLSNINEGMIRFSGPLKKCKTLYTTYAGGQVRYLRENMEMFTQMSCLEVVKFDWYDLIEENMLQAMAWSMPNLRCFEFACEVTEELFRIVSSIQSLVQLVLVNGKKCHDPPIHCLRHPLLEELVLFGIFLKEEQLTVLDANCPNLIHVYIDDDQNDGHDYDDDDDEPNLKRAVKLSDVYLYDDEDGEPNVKLSFNLTDDDDDDEDDNEPKFKYSFKTSETTLRRCCSIFENRRKAFDFEIFAKHQAHASEFDPEPEKSEAELLDFLYGPDPSDSDVSSSSS